LLRDTNDNEASINYTRDITGNAPYDTVRAAYPEYLKYNNNAVEVHFISNWDENDATDGHLRKDSPKSCYGSTAAPKVMETRKLEAIEVKVSNSLIRKYVFGYNSDPPDSTLSRILSGGQYGGIYYSGKLKLLKITQKIRTITYRCLPWNLITRIYRLIAILPKEIIPVIREIRPPLAGRI